jgi:hypothetical protein
LGTELFKGYSPTAVDSSMIRTAVSEKVNAGLGEETNEYEIIKLRQETIKS